MAFYSSNNSYSPSSPGELGESLISQGNIKEPEWVNTDQIFQATFNPTTKCFEVSDDVNTFQLSANGYMNIVFMETDDVLNNHYPVDIDINGELYSLLVLENNSIHAYTDSIEYNHVYKIKCNENNDFFIVYGYSESHIDTVTTTESDIIDSKAASLKLNSIRGKSEQDGEPTLNARADIKSSGDGGSLVVTAHGKNFYKSQNATKTHIGITAVFAGNNVKLTGKATSSGGRLVLRTDNFIMPKGSYLLKIVGNMPANSYLYVHYADGTDIGSTITQLRLSFDSKTEIFLGINVKPDISYDGSFDIQIMRTDEEDTTYEPYIEKTITIPLSEPLRSVDDVEDEIVKQDGLWGITRNIKNAINDIGKLMQHELTNDSYLVAFFSSTGYPRIIKAISTHFVQKGETALGKETSIYVFSSTKSLSPIHISIPTNIASNISELRTWLLENNVEINYPLLEPVFEPFLDEYQQMFYELESFENVTYITTDSEVEPEIEVEYATSDSGALMLNNYAKSNVSDLKASKALPENSTTRSKAVTEEGMYAVDAIELNASVPDTMAYEISKKANSDSPVFTNSVSMGRASGSTVGDNSTALGYNTIASGKYSHAEGCRANAIGEDSHAEGFLTNAYSQASHAEGYQTNAIGGISHAEGYQTNAIGGISHAEGSRTKAIGEDSHAEGSSTNASGIYSHAEGYGARAYSQASHAEGYVTNASGDYSHAEGYNTNAYGQASHAEGGNFKPDGLGLSSRTEVKNDVSYTVRGPLAVGYNSHAEGCQTFAYGYSSHAEGYQTNAIGDYSHTEGSYTNASGEASHAEGGNLKSDGTVLSNRTEYGNGVSYTVSGPLAVGYNSHAEGCQTFAYGYSSHAEGYQTNAIGDCSHAEGRDNSYAKGEASHAEGSGTTAEGIASHAEGSDTTAKGYYSHAEGSDTTSRGSCSHAEGHNTYAYTDASHAEGSYTNAAGGDSHAEGSYTNASGSHSHAEGYQTNACGSASHAEGSGTNAYGSYSHAEGGNLGPVTSITLSNRTGYANGVTYTIIGPLAVGYNSHAEGCQTFAAGYSSHAEGHQTNASGYYSHAEGYYTNASGSGSHAEGYYTNASGSGSHAEGYQTNASGSGSHAEGSGTTANNEASHAEGYHTNASGSYSHAEGYYANAKGSYSHAEGYYTNANGSYSHAAGYYTTTLDHQYVFGHYNNTSNSAAGSTSGTAGTAFAIGNGSSSSSSNAFRVQYNGQIYSQSSAMYTGADYAEYFEWADGNIDKEDRVGLFVTLDENNPETIRLANENDYILGIVSGMPSVVGNSDEDWRGRYILDDFGRYIEETFEYEDIEITMETVEVEETVEVPYTDEDGNEQVKTETITVLKEVPKETKVKKTGTRWKENPDYDPEQQYIQRSDRPEWDAIGMVGVLSVYDDGTCKVNGYCKCSKNGVATASETGYRVIKRISDNIVKVILK